MTFDQLLARAFPGQPAPAQFTAEDTTKLASAIRLTLQEEGAPQEVIDKALGAMIHDAKRNPEIQPEKRPLAIQALCAGFGYQVPLSLCELACGSSLSTQPKFKLITRN